MSHQLLTLINHRRTVIILNLVNGSAAPDCLYGLSSAVLNGGTFIISPPIYVRQSVGRKERILEAMTF